MPRKKVQLANNEIYHVVTRGIDDRLIFQNNSDYYRAVRNLFEFNNTQLVSWDYRYYRDNHRGVRPRRKLEGEKERELLVEVLAFCLMPNHVHLLLRQLLDGGISEFMKKTNGGYATYFNKKYERSGHLFQSRFKAIRIKTDQQLKAVFVYIHTNPVSLIDFRWKEGGIEGTERAIRFIENYKWSSYPDYLRKKNFPLVTCRDFFNQTMSAEKWREFVNDWVKFKSAKSFTLVALE